MNRAVITGMGATTPFGFGVDTLWESLLANKNGIKKVTDIDVRGEIIQISGALPKIDFSKEKFPELIGHIPEDDSNLAFFCAVQEAVKQAGINFSDLETTDRVGAFIADRQMDSSVYIDQYAPLLAQCVDKRNFDQMKYFELLQKEKPGKKTPFDDPDPINHLTSRVYNITGPQLNISTACASSNNAIGEAMLKIQGGSLDVIIAGGAFNYSLTNLIGFTRLGALSANPDPDEACCPFDIKRSGFIMGSGCGIVIMESLEHAKKRGAPILAEVVGYGGYSDAYRATDPDPTASGATRTISAAIKTAGINPSDIDYINAHGTSTKMNDLTETTAIKNVLKDHAYTIPVSSTKSMIGHSIMACGAIEAAACIKTLQNNVVHPTHNWKDRDPEVDLDYVPDEPREREVNYVLSNNFGFGGQNASVVYAKFKD